MKYFLASIALLIALVALYAGSAARRTQAELRAQLEQQGLALADAVETSSRNAIRSNALVEEMIAARLTDNARLIDELLRHPLDPAELRRVAARNRLRAASKRPGSGPRRSSSRTSSATRAGARLSPRAATARPSGAIPRGSSRGRATKA